MEKENVSPKNDFVLIKITKDTVNYGVIQTTQKSTVSDGEILAFSKLCKNDNFNVGDKVKFITHYDKIPYDEEENIYLISEKAILCTY